MIGFLTLLVLLLIFWAGHSLADLSLQSEWMQVNKRRLSLPRHPLRARSKIWIYVLTGHALIHAGIVLIISGSPVCFLMEFIAHTLIDLCKGEKLIGVHTDVALHFACKVFYVYFLCHGFYDLKVPGLAS